MRNNYRYTNPIFVSAIFILLAMFTIQPGLAQEEQINLRLSRDFGYSSGTGQIQGTFSMKVSGPENLTRVEFYVDDKMIGEATAPPFNLQFTTDSFPLGLHTMSAIGYTADGKILQSNKIKAEYVSASEGMKTVGKILIPLFGLIVGVIVVTTLVAVLGGRGKSKLALGAQRNYGAFGGTICPKCQRPFPMHIYGLNLLTRKFDRCPYCGRWSVVQPYPIEALRQAEKAELTSAADGTQVPEESEEEKLRKELDESRYQGLD